MGKTLILAEKPSVGRDIAKVLNCKSSSDGYINGTDYIVTWCVGHLVQLCEPDEYDIKYKKWSFDTLPIIPEKFKLKPNTNTFKQFNIVKDLMNNSEIEKIICATDAGREGELIFRYTYILSGCKKPFDRLWISSMTDSAIRSGFDKLKSGKEYDNLYHSAKCRSESDWLVGINASRAFSLKYNANLSIGRVQTPTLALLVNRQIERINFKPEAYWEVKAKYDGFSGVWFDETTKETKIHDKSKAQGIADKVKGKSGAIKEIKNDQKKDPAPQLFDLTELQRACNRKFGFPASKTLDIVQGLYEKKLVTYPRTDSKYLTQDIIPTLKDRVNGIKDQSLKGTIEYINQKPELDLGKRYVDDTKVSDHHAIIPTEQGANLNSLSPEERKVYDAITRRFLAVFLPAYEYTITSIITSVEGELFLSKGKTIQKLGWMELYKDDKKADEDEESGEQTLPPSNVGDSINVKNVKLEEKQTKAPPSYTEATLLSAMEHAGRFIDDEELKEQLKEGGLGTPATRAAIIERLIKVGYIVREKKNLVPTEKGINLISILPNEIKSPELTGKWEKALSLMSKGQYSSEKFMESIINYSKLLIEEASKAKAVAFQRENKSGKGLISVGKCPLCGAAVIETSKGWSCSNWKETGCKFSLWKEDKGLGYFGKKLTQTMVKELIKNGRAHAKGLVNPKTKQKFDRDLILVHENQYWNIKVDFDTNNGSGDPGEISERKAPTLTEYICPSCKTGHLALSNSDKFKGLGCERWREGCKFSIPAEICGIKLEGYIEQIVNNGQTDVIDGFKSQKGNVFSAKLVVKDGKLEMEFGNRK